MKAYSMDLRERVLADCDAGLKSGAVAAKYRVSSAWVRRLVQTRQATGRIEPKTAPGPTPSWIAQGYAEALREAVARKPDATLPELKRELNLSVAISTLWAACRALGLTFKKKSAGPRSKTAPT
jgi:transposase